MRNKDKRNGLKITAVIFYIIYILAAMFAAVSVTVVDALPGKYICAGYGAIVVLSVITGILSLGRKRKKGVRITGLVLSILFAAAYVTGGIYMLQAGSFFNQISDNGKDLSEYCVVVNADSAMEKQEDLQGKDIYITSELNSEYLDAQKMLTDEMKEPGVSFNYEYSTDTDKLMGGLLDKSYEAIFLSKGIMDVYSDTHAGFEDSTRIIYSVYVEKETASQAKAVDVTKEPFNIYITGLDTTGTIDVLSRSDVNMLVSVNPKTKKILLTSIPRDYYVKLHTYQQMDKLTHTGIYSADETVATAEDLLGCDINYYYKCNFTTVTNLVDAIGGVDVNSDFTFVTHGRQNEGFYFTAGQNHLNGASALAFARERKSFSDGDRQRIRNQQIVLAAVLDKVTSSSTLLTKYSSILSSLSSYIETNMSDTDIKAIVKMQLDDMAKWDIKKISLDGEGSSQPCYSAGNAYASVIMPDESSIEKAKEEIARIFAGIE